MTKETAQKQLDRALANLDRVANYLEEAGLTAQSGSLDGAATELRTCGRHWPRCEAIAKGNQSR